MDGKIESKESILLTCLDNDDDDNDDETLFIRLRLLSSLRGL